MPADTFPPISFAAAPVGCAMQLADARVSERPLFSERDRWFESAFLRRRVVCEPDFLSRDAELVAHHPEDLPRVAGHMDRFFGDRRRAIAPGMASGARCLAWQTEGSFP